MIHEITAQNGDKTLWFSELGPTGYGLSLRIDRMLADVKTPFQTLQIFENEAKGRVLILDDCVMLTEKEEPNYHEMLVHPALLAHPNPRDVLIIGAGDGGTLREVVKHPSVERAVLCEIDEEVVNYSRKFLPFTAVGLEHPKAEVFIGDGIEFMKRNAEGFDVIIVDSTDPVGMAEGLFQTPFYKDVQRSLRKPGIFVQQAESPYFLAKEWKQMFKDLKGVFSSVHPFGSSIPMYPTGYWTFAFASNELDPWSRFSEVRAQELGELFYYTPAHQYGAFAIPAGPSRLLEE